MELPAQAVPGVETLASAAAEAACALADAAGPTAWNLAAAEHAVDAIDTLAEALAEIDPEAARLLAAIPAATKALLRHLGQDQEGDADRPAAAAAAPRAPRTGRGRRARCLRTPPFPAVSVGVTLELVATMGIKAGVTTKRRRCEFKRCRRLLPKDASPRRRFCGPNCVAGAYRMRRRRERADMLMATIVDDKALEFLYSDEGYHSRLLAWQTCGGPKCRVVLWAGVRRRSNSRYCSAKCRQAAYRERQRARS